MTTTTKTTYNDSLSDYAMENNVKGKEDIAFQPNSNSGNLSEDQHKWIVLIVTFLIYVISGGVHYTGGIIIPELLVSFPNNGEATISLIISLVPGMLYLTALFAGCFCELYGEQKVCLVGSALIALGFLTSSFVTNIGFLYFTYGVLVGMGLGFQFLPCLVIVQKYFPKHHALATSAIYSASSVGVFSFSYILRLLIDSYSWRGGMLLMAAITVHAVPFSLVLVPPYQIKGEKPHNEPEKSQMSSGHIGNYTNSVNALLDGIKKVFQKLSQGFKDLKELQFVLLILTYMFKYLEAAVPYVFLPLKLLSLEYSKWEVATLVAILGIGDFLGRLLVGVQSVTCKFNRKLFFASALLVSGGTEIIVGTATEYYILCACACCLGICGGITVSSVAPLLLDIMGQERVPRCYGLAGIGRGMASLVSLPLQAERSAKRTRLEYTFYSVVRSLGWWIAEEHVYINKSVGDPENSALFYEISGDINIPFFISGAFPIIGFFLMIPVYIICRRKYASNAHL